MFCFSQLQAISAQALWWLGSDCLKGSWKVGWNTHISIQHRYHMCKYVCTIIYIYIYIYVNIKRRDLDLWHLLPDLLGWLTILPVALKKEAGNRRIAESPGGARQLLRCTKASAFASQASLCPPWPSASSPPKETFHLLYPGNRWNISPAWIHAPNKGKNNKHIIEQMEEPVSPQSLKRCV